jgi:hypothetical protein
MVTAFTSCSGNCAQDQAVFGTPVAATTAAHQNGGQAMQSVAIIFHLSFGVGLILSAGVLTLL